MTIRTHALAVVLFAVLAPAIAEAQEAGSPGSGLILGSRVRVTSSAGSGVTGLVVAVDPHVVTLGTDAGVVKIPVSSISAVDLSLGKRRYTKRGMAYGAVIGLVFGLLAPVDETTDATLTYGDDSRGASAGYGMTLGMAYGAIIGALVKTDRWSRVDLGAAKVVAPSGRPALAVLGTLRF